MSHIFRRADMHTRIYFLADDPERWVPPLERLFVDEWQPYYGAGAPGDAAADLRACCNRLHLPVALVAVNRAGEAIGAVALKEDSVGSQPGQSPWLAAFVVEPAWRGRGIGTRLVASIEVVASALGFEAVYVSTDVTAGIFSYRGWRRIGSATSLRGILNVFRLDLADRRREP